MLDMSITLTMMMVSHVFAYVQPHQIVHIKYVQLFFYHYTSRKFLYNETNKQTKIKPPKLSVSNILWKGTKWFMSKILDVIKISCLSPFYWCMDSTFFKRPF